MSQRDLVHVTTALGRLGGGRAGVGVAVAEIDRAIGRGHGDMRTPLNLQSLVAAGHVEQLDDGTWALTDAGVARVVPD
ncbi:hypothetical protein PAI11_16050 [Patulibacter medicamentivorans]|uniref:Uncharacterized protein n=1 Tax=Patulibacter medicamentivorans TaxID=1097667 RepID=H0E478_9ACTN|nr:hypothetical protein [Patulibacter medicamentivorans]EHN11520.1 hypothetical protein PAI11_16050 [Patulibacter medicamentivorans]